VEPVDRVERTLHRKHTAMALEDAFPPGSPAFAAPPSGFDPRDAGGARLCGPVRRQPPNDQRCTAYATVAAMETWLCRAGTPAAAPLSVDDLFARAGGRSLNRAVKAAGQGFADEAGGRWRARFRQFGGPVSKRAELMCRYLVGGAPIIIAIPFFQNLSSDPGSAPYEPGGSVVDAHAVCIVGYEGSPSGPGFWIVQNSAGTGWGDGGCTRIKRGHGLLKPEISAYAVLGVTRSGA
jgi:hypothetical protein